MPELNNELQCNVGKFTWYLYALCDISTSKVMVTLYCTTLFMFQNVMRKMRSKHEIL